MSLPAKTSPDSNKTGVRLCAHNTVCEPDGREDRRGVELAGSVPAVFPAATIPAWWTARGTPRRNATRQTQLACSSNSTHTRRVARTGRTALRRRGVGESRNLVLQPISVVGERLIPLRLLLEAPSVLVQPHEALVHPGWYSLLRLRRKPCHNLSRGSRNLRVFANNATIQPTACKLSHELTWVPSVSSMYACMRH